MLEWLKLISISKDTFYKYSAASMKSADDADFCKLRFKIVLYFVFVVFQ